MSETLYMEFEMNVEVDHPRVQLQDVARLACSDEKILNRVRVFPVASLDAGKPGRYVINVMDLVDKIGRQETNLDMVTTGETVFIVTYVANRHKNQCKEWLKAAFVCIITFFGMAFSIMTFNNDVDVGPLFGQIYEQFTGQASNGFTILEISYSVGIGLGVLFFFNHFGRQKLTQDPTPMQVQMRTYEDNVNHTIIEERERTQAKEKK